MAKSTEAAVRDLKFLGQRLKGIIDLVEFLEKVDSLENYIEELQGKISITLDEKKAAEEGLALILKQKRDNLEKIRNDRQKADDDVALRIAEASRTAKTIIHEAALKAENDRKGLEGKLEDLQKELTNGVIEVDKLRTEITKLENTKAEILEAIRKLKEKF